MRARRPQRGLVLRPRRRQGGQRRPAHHQPGVVHVDEVGGVAVAVVDAPGALGAVGLAGQLADVGGYARPAQEGGDLVGQGLDA